MNGNSILEGGARDFIKGLGPKPSVLRWLDGSDHWHLGIKAEFGELVVRGSQLYHVYGDYPLIVRLMRFWLKHLRKEGTRQIAQLDDYKDCRSSTENAHRALSTLIEQGEVEEGDSRGNWNFYTILPRTPNGVAEGEAKQFIMALPGSNARAKLRSMGLTVWKVVSPVRDGKVVCDEYLFREDVRGPYRVPDLSGCLTIWRLDSGSHNHHIMLWAASTYNDVILAESSHEVDWFFRLLRYALAAVIPKIKGKGTTEGKRQAKHLFNRFFRSDPPVLAAREGLGEGMAKDFFKALPGSEARTKLRRLGLVMFKVEAPVHNGKVVCDEFYFTGDDGWGGSLTVWRPDSGAQNHHMRLWLRYYDTTFCSESSHEVDWFMRLLRYVMAAVIPRVKWLKRTQAKRQAQHLIRRFFRSDPPVLTDRKMAFEGMAKDFFKRDRPVRCRLLGPWSYAGVTYWSWLDKCWTWTKSASTTDLRNLEEPLPKGTKAIEIVGADGGTIAGGAPVLSYWKKRYIPGYQPESFQKGSAADFIRAQRPSNLVRLSGMFHSPNPRCGFVWRYWSDKGWVKNEGDATIYDLKDLDASTGHGLPLGRETQVTFVDTGVFISGYDLEEIKRKYLVGYRTEAQEQLPLPLNDPIKFRPGTAKKFIKGIKLDLSPSSGEVIDNGRKFRRLLGKHRIKLVSIWPLNGELGKGKLIVVLLLSQGFGNLDKERPVQQNWNCYDVLRHCLRSWRNLAGVALHINGIPRGYVSYRNPYLA